MNISLSHDLQAALNASAQRSGVAPEELALEALRQKFLNGTVTPTGDWEQTLRGAATDCGVSLTHAALGSEGLYE